MLHARTERSRLRPVLALLLTVCVAAPWARAAEPPDEAPADHPDYVVFTPLISGPERYPAHDRAWEIAVLNAVNAERARVGLRPLREHAALTAAARRQALDVVQRDVLSHTGSDGSLPAARATQEGYPGRLWTEAGAANYPTPEATVQGWMTSPAGHREIVLDRTGDEAGVGFAFDGQGDLVGSTFLKVGVSRLPPP